MKSFKTFPLELQWPAQSPFLSCFYAKSQMESIEDTPFESGFPKHPHVGHEILTWMRKGVMDFADSTGVSARFGQGDLMWVTAGQGLEHSEMFPASVGARQDQDLECLQIWLDLPADQKRVAPGAQLTWGEAIPRLEVGGALMTLLDGEWKGQKGCPPPHHSWAHEASNHLRVFALEVPGSTRAVLPLGSEGALSSLYFFSGERCLINTVEVMGGHGLFLQEGGHLTIETLGSKPCEFLVLQSKPKKETSLRYGPFIVNNEVELKKSMESFRSGDFGKWPWPHEAVLFSKNEGRFFQKSGGCKERPPQSE